MIQHVVRKPNKNIFSLDARKLNALTLKDAYPLQTIDGILSRIDHGFEPIDRKQRRLEVRLLADRARRGSETVHCTLFQVDRFTNLFSFRSFPTPHFPPLPTTSP